MSMGGQSSSTNEDDSTNYEDALDTILEEAVKDQADYE